MTRILPELDPSARFHASPADPPYLESDDQVEPMRRTLAGDLLARARGRYWLEESTRGYARVALEAGDEPAEILPSLLEAIGPTSPGVAEVIEETLREILGTESEGGVGG